MSITMYQSMRLIFFSKTTIYQDVWVLECWWMKKILWLIYEQVHKNFHWKFKFKDIWFEKVSVKEKFNCNGKGWFSNLNIWPYISHSRPSKTCKNHERMQWLKNLKPPSSLSSFESTFNAVPLDFFFWLSCFSSLPSSSSWSFPNKDVDVMVERLFFSDIAVTFGFHSLVKDLSTLRLRSSFVKVFPSAIKWFVKWTNLFCNATMDSSGCIMNISYSWLDSMCSIWIFLLWRFLHESPPKYPIFLSPIYIEKCGKTHPNLMHFEEDW